MKLQVVIIIKSIAIKNKCTNNALHQVIGKCHLACIGQSFHQPGNNAAAKNKQDQAYMAKTKKEPAYITQYKMRCTICINIHS